MDNNAPELKRMFVSLGFDVRADETAPFATGERPGRSDLTLIRAGKGVFVELKSGTKSWTLKNWTTKQRNYGHWCETQNRSELFIGLTVGADPPHYDPAKYLPRRTFLIPFSYAIQAAVKAEIDLGVAAIPYKLFKTTSNLLKEAQFSCVDLFAEWELFWQEGAWFIPERHTFHKNYISEAL